MEQLDLLRSLSPSMDSLKSMDKATLEKFVNEIELVRNYALEEEVEPE